MVGKPSKIDLVFERKVFGELEAVDTDSKGRIKCKCSCGKTPTYQSGQLLDGVISCCGHTFGGINKKNALRVGKFEKLTVVDGDTGSKEKVNCVCECGAELPVRYKDLFLKVRTACDKCKDDRTRSMKIVDSWVEESFRKDMLVAIGRNTVKTNRNMAHAWFKCDCGNTKSFSQTGILKLEYGSCGCYKPKEIKPSPATEKALNLGTFTNWTALDWCRDDNRYLDCVCKCGTKKRIRSDSLLTGESTSCGCLQREMTSLRFKGKYNPNAVTRHPLYGRYKGMFGRCYNENNIDYKHYGARGISVCERWTSPPRDLTGFFNFIEDMESSYFDGSEIERIDVNGNYSPDNCTWVCRKSQVNNLRRNRKLKGFGIELNVVEWGYLLNFNCKMLDDRINKLKWDDDLEKLLDSAFRDRRHHILFRGEVLTAGEVWSKLGYTQGQVNGRLNKYGDSISALSAEGVVFEIVKEREKDIYTFEEGLSVLESKQNRTPFEDHLLFKIKDQLKEK